MNATGKVTSSGMELRPIPTKGTTKPTISIVNGSFTFPNKILDRVITRDVPGKKREKIGNGKEIGKNAFLSFPVPPFSDDLFSRFWPKSSKIGEKRGGTAKNGRSTPFQIVEFGEIPFFYTI